MAVGDIFYVRFNCSTNNRAWRFGLYSEEISPASPADNARVVSDAVHAYLQAALRAIITDASRLDSVEAWRRHPTTAMPGVTYPGTTAGTRTGDSMPNDNALYINLRQSAQNARFNGGIYIAGQSDSDHTANEWNSAYLTTQVKAFTDLLPGTINAVGADAGQWRFIVLSKAFAPAQTPIGSPFDITSALANERVMTQRRRQQKAFGYNT